MSSLLLNSISFRLAHGSKAWFKNHVNDEFVKKANQLNYRSRAAFKLQQIQLKYKVLGEKIIDLGSAPGSWSQFAMRYKNQCSLPKTRIVSVDILEMKMLEGVDFYKCDATDLQLQKNFKSKYGYFDSIISDMSPNFSGVNFQTHEEMLSLNKMCVKLALEISHQKCSLVMKTTEGSQSKIFHEFLELIFESADRFKPKASRSESEEFYFVCKNLNKDYYCLESKVKDFISLSEAKKQQRDKQNIQNKKGAVLLRFINQKFDQILFRNQNSKINKKQLKKIMEQYLFTETNDFA